MKIPELNLEIMGDVQDNGEIIFYVSEKSLIQFFELPLKLLKDKLIGDEPLNKLFKTILTEIAIQQTFIWEHARDSCLADLKKGDYPDAP